MSDILYILQCIYSQIDLPLSNVINNNPIAIFTKLKENCSLVCLTFESYNYNPIKPIVSFTLNFLSSLIYQHDHNFAEKLYTIYYMHSVI